MESPAAPNNTSSELANDLLRGAAEIAEFIYGERELRRKVYYLVEYARAPVFRLGATLCARKSVLLKWISDQERQGLGYSGYNSLMR